MADLPVDIADPVERLTAIRTELESLKASKEAEVGEALVGLGRYSPYPLASMVGQAGLLAAPAGDRHGHHERARAQRAAVRDGPQAEEIIPYVPIASRVRTGISIFSYCGAITFGLTGDFATNPDLDVLARGIETGVSELLAAARKRSRPARGRRPPAAGG